MLVNRAVFYWLPVVVWIVGIFVVSAVPNISFPARTGSFFIPTEYLLHITAFFVLFLLFYRLLGSGNRGVSVKGILLACLALTLLVSGLKECWQLMFPTRSFSVKDLLVDAGAAGAAMVVAWLMGQRVFSR